MKTYSKILSIIVPCYNEEESVPLFYAETIKQETFFHEKDVEFEFIFVDKWWWIHFVPNNYINNSITNFFHYSLKN